MGLAMLQKIPLFWGAVQTPFGFGPPLVELMTYILTLIVNIHAEILSHVKFKMADICGDELGLVLADST